MSRDKISQEVSLDLPDCNKDGSNSYADMKYPNVTFANNKVIYNYPYDSGIHTIDLATGERHAYNVDSGFAENSLKPYKGDKSMENWLGYDWSNPHFYEASYMPQTGLHARFMLGGIDTVKYKDRQTIVDAKRLYVAFLDRDFNLVGEFALKENRYSNFNGLCVLPNAIIIYDENLLGQVQDNLAFDVIAQIN